MSIVGRYTSLQSHAAVFHSVINGFLRQGRPDQLQCIFQHANGIDSAQQFVNFNKFLQLVKIRKNSLGYFGAIFTSTMAFIKKKTKTQL